MTVLVTGATGFIGRHALALLAAEQPVVALARGAPPAELEPHATWISHDLASGLDRRALPAHVDTVLHLAQSERYRDFPEGADDVVAVNVDAVAALADYALGVGARRFVLCSTGGVYGFRHGPAREGDPAAPIGFYQASKYAAELLLAPYAALMHTVVARPFFVYGPGQRGMLISNLAERVVSGETVTIDGDPGLRINPIEVRDAAAALVAAAVADHGVDLVNVAGTQPVTLTELVESLGEAAGVEPQIVHRGDGPPGDLLGDPTRMAERLGVRPQIPLAGGLRGVVDALRTPH